MSGILISGGIVLDQTGERTADVRIVDGVVSEVGERLSPVATTRPLDASGWIVSPGFVDLHTHLREPGREEAETIETGSRAAAKGGYTCVVAMPNTDPTQDSVSVIEFVRRQGEVAGLCDVRPSGSITIGRQGQQLVAARRAGRCRCAPVHRRRRRCPGSAADASSARVRGGSRNRARPALRGQTAHRGRRHARGTLLFEVRPARVALDRRGTDGVSRHRVGAPDRGTGSPPAPLDRTQRRAGAGCQGGRVARSPPKRRPHHISLTDELLAGYNALYKVNPPLRTMADVEAVRAGLADGTIDAIATDHAPHAPETKEQPLDQAPPGMLGLETALGVSLASLDMPVADVVAALSWKPAAIAGVADQHGRPISAGRTRQLDGVRSERRLAGACRPSWPARAETPPSSVSPSREG